MRGRERPIKHGNNIENYREETCKRNVYRSGRRNGENEKIIDKESKIRYFFLTFIPSPSILFIFHYGVFYP